jgi:hypothetical protein
MARRTISGMTSVPRSRGASDRTEATEACEAVRVCRGSVGDMVGSELEVGVVRSPLYRRIVPGVV